MNLNDLAARIKKEIDSGDYPLQVVFDRNLSEIEQLKASGIPYKRIYGQLNIELNYEHFRTLLKVARKKKNKMPLTTQSSEVVVNKTSGSNPDIPSPTHEGKTKEYWYDILGFDISDRLLKSINKSGLTDLEIKEKQFPNSTKLSDFLIENAQRMKYKKP